MISHATVGKITSKEIADKSGTALDNWLATQLASAGKGDFQSVPKARLLNLTRLGSGVLPSEEAANLYSGAFRKRLNWQNVRSLAISMVQSGIDANFQLNVAIIPPCRGGAPKMFQAELIGGAHRLAAIKSVATDFERLSNGEKTWYDWGSSPFSLSVPPPWMVDIPVKLHYVGRGEHFDDRVATMAEVDDTRAFKSASVPFCDIIEFVNEERAQGTSPTDIYARMPGDIPASQRNKVLRSHTTLSEGSYPALDLMKQYYAVYFASDQPEFFSPDRLTSTPCKVTRAFFDPPRHGRMEDRHFGTKVFVVLALKYQALLRDGAPNLYAGLNVRVLRDCRLATTCEPYAQLLSNILRAIETSIKTQGLLQGIPVTDNDGERTEQLISQERIGMAVINDLLERECFLPAAESADAFQIPEPRVLHERVCDTICRLVGHTVNREEVRKNLRGLPGCGKRNGPDTPEPAAVSRTGDTEVGVETGVRSPDDVSFNSRTDTRGSSGDDSDTPTVFDKRDDAPSKAADVNADLAPVFSYTGLSRLSADAMGSVMAAAGTRTPPLLHTIVIHEEDPQVGSIREHLDRLRHARLLHPFPVVVALSSMTRVQSHDDDSSDSDGRPTWKEELRRLAKFLGDPPGKRCSSVALDIMLSDPMIAQDIRRSARPQQAFTVDSGKMRGTLTTQATIIACHDERGKLKMRFSPNDPTEPWRLERSGYPLKIWGRCITSLPKSDRWNKELSERQKRTVAFVSQNTSGRATSKEIIAGQLSIDCLVSLLARFHASGTFILAPWDPCGVIQGAALHLGEDSVAFLGMKSRSTEDALKKREVPLMQVEPLTGADVMQITESHASHKARTSGPSLARKSGSGYLESCGREDAPASYGSNSNDQSTPSASALAGGGTQTMEERFTHENAKKARESRPNAMSDDGHGDRSKSPRDEHSQDSGDETSQSSGDYYSQSSENRYHRRSSYADYSMSEQPREERRKRSRRSSSSKSKKKRRSKECGMDRHESKRRRRERDYAPRRQSHPY